MLRKNLHLYLLKRRIIHNNKLTTISSVHAYVHTKLCIYIETYMQANAYTQAYLHILSHSVN